MALPEVIVRIRLSFLCFLVCIPLAGEAQGVPNAGNAVGTSPLAVYEAGEIDNVNPFNGNVFINIPLLSYPQLGHSLRLTYRLYANDKQWFITDFVPQTQLPETGYWSFNQNGGSAVAPAGVGAFIGRDQYLDFGADFSSASQSGGSEGQANGGYVITTNWNESFVRSLDGAKHYYADSLSQNCSGNGCSNTSCTWCAGQGGSASYPATDASGYVPPLIRSDNFDQITGPDGVVYTHSKVADLMTVADTAGNTITSKSNGWTDTVGRLIPGSRSGPGFTYSNDGGVAGTGDPIPGVQIDPSATTCPASTAAARSWVVPVHDGTTGTYFLCYRPYSYTTHFNLNSVYGIAGNIPEASSSNQGSAPALMMTAVVLPNGTSYLFDYDEYLSLISFTLPTGASVEYTWQNVPLLAGDLLSATPITRALATRTVNPGGGQPAEHFSYHWVVNTKVNAPVWSIVTDSAGNDVERLINVLSGGATQVNHYFGCGPNDTTPDRTCGTGSPALLEREDNVLTQFGSGGRDGLPSRGFVGYQPTTTTTTLYNSDGSTTVSQSVRTMASNYGSCSYFYNISEFGTSQKQQYTENLCYSTNQVQSEAIYDYGAGAPGSLLRTTTTNYAWQTLPAYLNVTLLTLPQSVAVSGPGASAETDYSYDENNGSPQGAFGNLTSITRINAQTSPVTQTVYNAQGMPTLLIDANSNQTSLSAYQCSGLFPTSVTVAYKSSTTTSESSSYTHDCSTGKLTSSTDPNGVTTQYSYSDPLNRLTLVDSAQGAASETQTRYSYPSMTQVNTAQDQNGRGDGLLTRSSSYDGLGNVVRTTSPAGSVVDTMYNSMGRVLSISNPHFGGSTSTDGVTSFAYDALGRKTLQCQPDNGTSGSTCTPGSSSMGWNYNGNAVTMTDEAGRARRSVSDGLGRLTDVYEDSSGQNLHTQYAYTALGDLTSVTQAGTANETARSRGFTYDSLSRLLTANNPETGLVCYGMTGGSAPSLKNCTSGYDNNGNLLHKTDARGVQINATYDALNRMLTQTASDNSIAKKFTYDQGANGIGRLYSVTNGSSAGSQFTYDPLGRTTGASYMNPAWSGWQPGITAGYDLVGEIIALSYPDYRNITQTWSGGRLVKVSDVSNASSAVDYVSSLSYTPAGAQQGAVYGNGTLQIASNNRFNSRNQPCQTQLYSPALVGAGQYGGLFNKGYYYQSNWLENLCGNASGNNGNIAAIVDFGQTGLTQSFSYDSLNRLHTANRSDGGYNQTYNIDSFGNLLPPVPQQSSWSYTVDPATNRLQRFTANPLQSDFRYDLSGNLNETVDAFGTHPYVYDALGELLTIDSGNTASYTYDGLGERVFKSTPGAQSTLDYVYLNGQVMSEHTSDGNYRDFIYANGTKIASVARFDIRFHLSGVNGSTNDSNRSTVGYLPLPQNPVIQPGDVLSYRMFQNNATAGISIGFTDGSNSDSSCSACRTPLSSANQWVSQNIPLSSAMNGKTISSFALGNYPGGSNGQFDVMIADVALNHADGSVTPFPFSIQNFSTGGDTTAVSNIRFFGEQVARDSGVIGAQALTRYFSGDHLGTAQFELSSGGWPVWEGQFTPYGQELDTQQTYNNYKFTGKERDAESGLDYFGARYYASSMGRWMSPDWADKPEAVPYSNLANPQSLNLYGYVNNNPLSQADADGHYFVVSAAMQQQVQQYISTLLRTPQGAATINAIASSSLPVSFGLGTLPSVNNGNGSMSVTAGTTVAVPGSTPGAIGGANVTLDNSNISTISEVQGKSDFQVGLTAFTHEDQHVTDILGAKTFQGAAAAGAAGDAPSQPGANNTTGGTAEGRAQQIVGALGGAGKNFQPNAQYDGAAAAILKQGAAQQQKAACSGSGGSCPQ